MKILFFFIYLFSIFSYALPPEKWINDHPLNEYHKQNFFSNWPIQKQLRKLFTSEELKQFFEIIPNGVAVPVEKHGKYLKAYVCMAHACHSKNYNFFYNTKSKKLSICRINYFDTKSEDRKWYGPKVESKDKTIYPKDDERYCDVEF
jgi:hypothetical protein